MRVQDRMNRASYWTKLTVLLAIGALVLIFLPKASSGVSGLAGAGLSTLAIPRLHDLGRTGWWIALAYAAIGLALVPMAFDWLSLEQTQVAIATLLAASGIAAVVLGLIPGNPGSNRYGEPPRGRFRSSHG